MIIVAFTNESGEVMNVVSPGADSDYVDGGKYGPYTARHLPHDLDWNEVLTRYVFTDDGWVIRPPKPGDYYIWDKTSNSWKIDTDRIISVIRMGRNQKLYASDWTQLPVNNLTQEQKEAWEVYRNKLRDITNNIDLSIDDPGKVEWPVPPT